MTRGATMGRESSQYHQPLNPAKAATISANPNERKRMRRREGGASRGTVMEGASVGSFT